MSEEKQSKPTLFDGLANRLVDVINSADEAEAQARVEKLRQKQPDATSAELAEQLIKQKCLKTGAVGAVTSGSALIPGLGTFASLTFGVAADIGMTFKLQAELVLEIAAAYGHELTDNEKRTAVLTVTGISAGANQLISAAGKQISKEATERLVQQSALKALPIIGVGASAGINLLTTYIIGQRANAYFGLGPDKMDEWDEGLRAIVGVDERKLAGWLGETTRSSWDALSDGASSAGNAVVDAGQWVGGGIVAVGSGVAGGVSQAASGAASAGQRLVGLFRREKTDPNDTPEPETPSVKGVVAILTPDHTSEAALSETAREAEETAQAAEAGQARGIFRIFNFRRAATDEEMDEGESVPEPMARECEDEDVEERQTVWGRILGVFNRDEVDEVESVETIEEAVRIEDEAEEPEEKQRGIYGRLRGLFRRKKNDA